MKISKDQLVAVGKLLAGAGGAKVRTVKVNGMSVPVQEAIDAFEALQKVADAPPGKVAKIVASLQAKAETAQQKMMRNTVMRFVLEHIKPVDELVEHEKVQLQFTDGSSKEIDLPIVDTKFNRAIHQIAEGSGLVGLVPFLGFLGFAGSSVGSAIAAGATKLVGNDDKARMLWQVAQTNFYRLVGEEIPVVGNLVDAVVVSQEARASSALHAATVGDLTSSS